MSSYVLGLEAGRDLDDVWEFLAQDRLDVADRVIAGIFEAFDLLARNPGIGHKREDLTQFPVLFWSVGSYLVIYRVAGSIVEIVAVVHGKRDIPSFLRQRGPIW